MTARFTLPENAGSNFLQPPMQLRIASPGTENTVEVKRLYHYSIKEGI